MVVFILEVYHTGTVIVQTVSHNNIVTEWVPIDKSCIFNNQPLLDNNSKTQSVSLYETKITCPASISQASKSLSLFFLIAFAGFQLTDKVAAQVFV